MSSFLNKRSEYISAKLTNKGRQSIAKGDFKISYFEVGDSEFNYERLNKKQKVTVPIENSPESKYPFLMDNTNDVSYGVPVNNQNKVTVRNLMGPAGMVNGHQNFESQTCEGSSITSHFETFFLSSLNGTNTLTITDQTKFDVGDHITLLFDELCGTDPDYPTVNTNTLNSLVYKIISKNGTTLTLDRKLPIYNLVGFGHLLNNKYYLNYDVRCGIYENDKQQDSWLLNIIWDGNIIGFGGLTVDQDYQEFVNSQFTSIKEYFGYNSDESQLFLDFLGNNITGFDNNLTSTGFYDCDGNFHVIKPSEQRCIALLHYSKHNQFDYDKDKEFKYDDYISTNDNVSDYLTLNSELEPISDTEYFEVYLPFLMYHRSKNDTLGLLMKMEDNDHFIVSRKNNKSKIKFRYLIDENGIRLGKVFVDFRLVIFDDQEIVASLDYRSKRRFTLPAPNVSTIPSISGDSLFLNGQKQTVYVTYMIKGDNTEMTCSLPCNYYIKIETPSTETNTGNFNLGISFNEDELKYLVDSKSSISVGYNISEIMLLVQETEYGELPKPDEWKIINVTDQLVRNSEGLVNSSVLSNTNFTIHRPLYNESGIFDIEQYLGIDYIKSPGVTSPQFGETQYFPGSVKLIRSSDIEVMDFLVNLPVTQFNITQNPTYKTGDKYITEVNLLNDKKDALVSGKLTVPIKRFGHQVFNIKIDF